MKRFKSPEKKQKVLHKNKCKNVDSGWLHLQPVILSQNHSVVPSQNTSD